MRFGKSLKARLAMSYLIIIIVTLVITDIALASVLRSYFNNNVRDTLYNQLSVSTDTYERYYSDATLEQNVANDEDAFWRQSNAMVQIISTEKIVLLDSRGNRPQGVLDADDVSTALEGSNGSMIYTEPSTGEKLMAVSRPLTVNNEIVGVLRFITSLRGVDESMRLIVTNFIMFGIVVIIFSTIFSNILGMRFIRPIDKLTKTAEIMATGNYNVVSVKMHEDEIGKLSDTLNHMASEIKKKEELKNDFISSVSHELRTPLTSIKGWAVTIKDPSTDRELLEQGLDIISNESDRLKSMVDELLDFSKFVSGKITLEKQEIDIRELFDFIRNHMENRAFRENKTLIVEKEEDMGTVYADLNRVKQVFINLLDNSFKFTKEGGEISVRMKRTRNWTDFIVEDDGEGISVSDIHKVKEKFYKGKTSNSSNGIGLSICDEIAIIHGGELIIESEVSQGTKITFRLPQGA
ncbi:HAMP domain-containing sensor histidine kinase [Proteiniclasticum sp.]|uniref:sensor histidine kinase n=1 Tax=Proteiniclasticum sp. TaxID=2053595 RepID=UPI002896FEFF|nr:HAMP domain-containing sensor histidine kinase [Proteiniclasticum sp.]